LNNKKKGNKKRKIIEYDFELIELIIISRRDNEEIKDFYKRLFEYMISNEEEENEMMKEFIKKTIKTEELMKRLIIYINNETNEKINSEIKKTILQMSEEGIEKEQNKMIIIETIREREKKKEEKRNYNFKNIKELETMFYESEVNIEKNIEIKEKIILKKESFLIILKVI
jgi:hypothetical protein